MIRAATHHDIPALLELGARMQAESPRFSRLTFSRARLSQTLTDLIDNPNGFLWVAHGERIYGAMVAVIGQHWSSEDLVSTELALFVDADKRGGSAAVRLLMAYVQWARGKGVAHPQMGVSTGIKTEETARLYEKLGMTRCGVILEA